MSEYRGYLESLLYPPPPSPTRRRIPARLSAATAPINTLPNELLTHIFHLVQVKEPCFLRNNHRMQSSECLSHVCSLWRDIALVSRVLWSHIDIIPTDTGRTRANILTRARTLADRAGDNLVTIHICDQTPQPSYWGSASVDFLPFCESVGPRTRSMQLYSEDSSGFSWTRPLELSDYFHKCVPGTLTRLALKNNRFWVNQELMDRDKRSFDRLDNFLLPIIVLELDGTYPGWASQAYRGLVELRLLCSQSYFFVPFTAGHLAGILGSSPELRVLQLGLKLTDDVHGGRGQMPLKPVCLNELEVLDLKSLSSNHQRTILSLIVPGSKSLELLTKFPKGSMSLLAGDEFFQFFKRSNVTRLYLSGSQNRTFILIHQLLNVLPNVQALHLEHVRIMQDRKLCGHCNSLRPQLYTLRIQNSDVNLNILQQVLQAYSVSALTMQSCRAQLARDSFITISDLESFLPPINQFFTTWDELVGVNNM